MLFYCVFSKQLVKMDQALIIFSTGFHVVDGVRYSAGAAKDSAVRKLARIVEIQNRIQDAITG